MELKLLSEQGLGCSQLAGEFRLRSPQESIQLKGSAGQLKEIRELLRQLNLQMVEQQHLQPVRLKQLGLKQPIELVLLVVGHLQNFKLRLLEELGQLVEYLKLKLLELDHQPIVQFAVHEQLRLLEGFGRLWVPQLQPHHPIRSRNRLHY
jgi:hypothetical protein